MTKSLTTTILFTTGTFLSIYLYHYMHKTFFQERAWFRNHKPVSLLIYLLTGTLWCGATFVEIPVVNLIASIASYFIPLAICYHLKNIRGYIYYAFYSVGTLLMEIAVGLITGILDSNLGYETHYDVLTPQIAVILNLLELILVLCLCKFGNKEKQRKLNKLTAVSMIMPVFSIILIIFDLWMLSSGQYGDFNPKQYMFTAVILLVVNVAVFISLEKYTILSQKDIELTKDKLELQADADFMKIATRSMQERLELSEEMINKDKVMRHDRRHFEATLLTLLKEGNTELAIKNLEERLAIEPKTIKRYCDNSSINAAISHYISMAENENIPVSVSMSIPSTYHKNELELSITLSNLLENAIHACEKLPENERYIKLTSKYKKQLLIEIENSFDGKAILDEEGHPCTKQKDHGIGTRSVLAFANNTGSDVIYSVAGNVFRVRMIIR